MVDQRDGQTLSLELELYRYLNRYRGHPQHKLQRNHQPHRPCGYRRWPEPEHEDRKHGRESRGRDQEGEYAWRNEFVEGNEFARANKVPTAVVNEALDGTGTVCIEHQGEGDSEHQ